MLLIVNFPRILPLCDIFYKLNSLLTTLELIQSRVYSLYTTCILSRISHTEDKVHMGNNQSRSPLRRTILIFFLLEKRL